MFSIQLICLGIVCDLCSVLFIVATDNTLESHYCPKNSSECQWAFVNDRAEIQFQLGSAKPLVIFRVVGYDDKILFLHDHLFNDNHQFYEVLDNGSRLVVRNATSDVCFCVTTNGEQEKTLCKRLKIIHGKSVEIYAFNF